MSKSIIVYQHKTPVLTYINAQDELIVVILTDTSKSNLKTAISKIMGKPKKYIKIVSNTHAVCEEYLRQLDFTLGYIKND